jgi:hypothetical protein
MEKFDYLILDEDNNWLSTGKAETEKQLDDEIERLKTEDAGRDLVVFKAPHMESFRV